jgi:thiamine-phosphate pyrophosphorylase
LKPSASLFPLQIQNKFALCYVTDSPSLPAENNAGLREMVRKVADAGVDWVQFREKAMPAPNLLALVREAARTKERMRVLVNDRLDVVVASEADGVHLGGESLRAVDVVAWLRAGRMQAGFQIGISCHELNDIQQAERDGADYVFFGPVFPTPSKARFGPPQGLAKLADVCRRTRLPVLAIGGITAENASECARAGAAGIAATRLFQQAGDLPDIIHRLRREN